MGLWGDVYSVLHPIFQPQKARCVEPLLVRADQNVTLFSSRSNHTCFRIPFSTFWLNRSMICICFNIKKST